MNYTPGPSVQKRQQLQFPWESPPENGHWQTVAEGVVWLRMPLPFGLDHINLYLLQHDDGWVVVDTGLGTEQSREVWERVFREVMGGAPVKAVIATHFHHDHAGCLGWLARRFKCPVYMTHGEYHALFISPPEEDEPNWEFSQFYARSGVSEERQQDFLRVVRAGSFEQDVPTSYNRLIHEQVLRIGGRDWQIVIGSGHSPEHACLYCHEDRLFISGDQVLPGITSSVCVAVTEPEANPLKNWLDSIERLRGISDEVLVLPAHERPFYGLHCRLHQLTEHHHKHLDAMLGQLDDPKTADQMMAFIFPRAQSPFDALLANGETLAHLNFLMSEKRITRRLEGECFLYQRAGDAGEPSARTQVTHIS
ncbi:MAG: MBL fold metallo-hydrolase [Marinobacter sp.]|uniref:MBL fold metallo-hydrolase n=1 Tax=Marinobacter sp. TaxID=50741 RepID=UPI00329846BE